MYIYIRFGTKIHKQLQVLKINVALIFEDICFFCFDNDIGVSALDNTQDGVSNALNATSRYLDDLLNIGNPSFEDILKRKSFATV